MSGDPQSKPEHLAAPEAPAVPGATDRNTGLKLVTIAAADSLSDVDAAAVRQSLTEAPRVDPYLGCTIDNRYKVEEVLGEGGMGVVYRCRHKIIDKKVAMKILRADMARDQEVTERFLLEARAASAIGNEHIIDIIDFGQLPDGSTYFVMEYLDGRPLTRLVDGQKPVAVGRILHVARQIAEGLAAAHEAGIVHRDLKPDNVYLVPRGGDPEFVKILDFGIAKVSTTAAGRLTRAGSVFGTPHYMSPEQAAGSPVDHRGDIYSIGIILYEMSCGKVPFDADNFMGILTQHMYKAPVPIRALVPPPQEIPPGLEAIVLKCLSKRPEQRYQSMGELIADMDRLSDGVVPEAVSEMMSRSGGFNVPADFFKQHGKMPMALPATPLDFRPKRWPLYVGLTSLAVAAIAFAGLSSRGSDSPAFPEPPAPQPVKVAQAPAPAPEEKVEEPVNQPVPVTPVVIATQPPDALVYKGSEELGSPTVVSVPDGEEVTLKIERKGYATKRVTLDGKKAKMTIKLVPLRRATAKAPASSTAKVERTPATSKSTKTPIGGGEIVNPWR